MKMRAVLPDPGAPGTDYFFFFFKKIRTKSTLFAFYLLTKLEESNILPIMKLTTREEDYLETIFRLSERSDEVGISDVARARGVTMPTVISAVTRLKRNGLIRKRHYGKINLNPAGRKRAEEIYRRHKAIKAFLVDILELSQKNAEQEACRMEHAMSRKTIMKLVNFMDKVQECPMRHSTVRVKSPAIIKDDSLQ